ncbi:conserved hypothetical protein [uncultured Paludibacter sp.]|uniref:Uncharacterized protein n=1 Tax=uncultured Paludibacter sp. TaxID=497635 RepID=A0A653AIT8_9BACT|nr:conserved hypothetical protein [uncultured Paludibacter sp.]
MGVTINFQGKLKSKENFKEILKISKDFAEKNNMPFSIFEEKDKLLLRVKDGKDWDYKGLTKGIRIQPHKFSDPLNLEFDKNYIIQEYCKTQYVDIETHVKIIDFLRQIEPYFDWLNVDDEGEYWETNNIEILRNHIEKIYELIEDAKQKNEKLDGPFRVKDGRIVDLMEKQENSNL